MTTQTINHIPSTIEVISANPTSIDPDSWNMPTPVEPRTFKEKIAREINSVETEYFTVLSTVSSIAPIAAIAGGAPLYTSALLTLATVSFFLPVGHRIFSKKKDFLRTKYRMQMIPRFETVLKLHRMKLLSPALDLALNNHGVIENEDGFHYDIVEIWFNEGKNNRRGTFNMKLEMSRSNQIKAKKQYPAAVVGPLLSDCPDLK